GQMGTDLGGRDGPQVGEAEGLAAMPGQEGEVEAADVTVGLEGAGRQPALVGQMLQPGRQRLFGAQAISGHRSAIRSTTRAMKATSSQPMVGVKPSSSGEPKAHRAG